MRQADCSPRSVVIDNDLATVVIDIPIMIAPLDDNRVAIAAIAPFANHLAFANHVAVAMAFTDGHATRTYTNADFIRSCRQRGDNKRGSRHSG
jgi:hypothetical protein